MDVKDNLSGIRLGVIGKPSDWLIASRADYAVIQDKTGVELIDVPIGKLKNIIDSVRPDKVSIAEFGFKGCIGGGELKQAVRVYHALKLLIKEYGLNGGTVRCFDLILSHNTTSCLALAKLNADGYIFGCEGDVPALISILILKQASSRPVFMANPSRIDSGKNEVVLAHCTLPLDMSGDVELCTHFETDIGVGLRGKVHTGRGTLFRISGALDRYFLSGVDIIENLADPKWCRTQVLVKCDSSVDYFLKDPIGNHHILCNGDCVESVKKLIS